VGEEYVIFNEYRAAGLGSMAGRYPVAFRPAERRAFEAGRTVAIADIMADQGLTSSEAAAYGALGVRAFVSVPLVKNERLVVVLSVICSRSREWRPDEVELVQETAEGTWAAVERARAETALRESEARFRRAISVPKVGVLFFDLAGHIHEANRAFQHMCGYNNEELRSRTHWRQLTATEFHTVTAERAQDLAERGETPPYEKQMVRKDGTRWWGLFAPTRLSGSNLESECVEFVFDITDRKRAEEALRESEARFHTLFHATPSPYLVVVPSDFTITAVNDAYLRATMTEREAIVGRPLFEVFPENPAFPSGGMPSLRASLERVVAERRLDEMPVTKYDIPRPAAPGGGFEERWWKPRNAPVFGPDGLLVSIIHHVEDVTERVRAEAALHESEEKYRTLFDSIDEGFCTIEVLFDENERAVDYRFLQVNPSFGRQTGIANAAGRRMREIAPLHEEHWFETYGRVALTGEPVRFINQAAQLGRWYDVYAFRVEDARLGRVGILFNDITDRRRSEQSLRESERRQTILAAELRHRVRNLIAIVSEIVDRSAGSAKTIEEYAGLLGGRLMALARTQTLLTDPSTTTVELATIVHDEIRSLASHEGEYELSGPEVTISAKEAEVVGLAIHELATNALKYGALSEPGGRITVLWSVIPREGECWVTLDWHEKRQRSQNSPVSSRRGFGTELIERRIPYELHGASHLN